VKRSEQAVGQNLVWQVRPGKSAEVGRIGRDDRFQLSGFIYL